ncbi:protein BLISTER-like isoform X2 [Gossypium arboreum]|uniref:protein BLISTER-like isoform X2 n=1 Tax=Gossypium arboreum TaxID=29729 RepID=UPI0022F155A3|nr:protein BLISTER-like isoform X2 [Gossypium arboreum]
MASAEVLPSSRKQEHLEAGKRRLEEFRKKKAAERAKKVASTTQSYNTDVSLNDKHQLETEQVRAINSDGAGTSEGPNPSSLKTINNNNKTTEVSRENQQVYSNNAFEVPSFLGGDYNSSITEMQTHEKSQENEKYGAPWNGGPFSNDSLHTKRFSNDFLEPKSKEDDGSLKVSAVVTPISEDFVTKRSQQNSLQNKASEGSLLGINHVLSSFHEDSIQSILGIRGSMISDPGERNFSSSSSDFPSVLGPSTQISGSSEFNFDARGSSSHMPVHSVTDDTISRRSRPSFLDSLNVSKASSGSLFQHDKTTNNAFASHSSQFNSFNTKGSSLFEKPSTEIETMGTFSKLGFPEFPGAREYPGQYSVPVYNGDLLSLNVANENVSEKNHEFYSTKHNEDFAALEQHIEDLTQEKFSLQRALEATRTFAESLAAENSSLTDSCNQQRSVVNQLKSDMEKLQEEIKAQLNLSLLKWNSQMHDWNVMLLMNVPIYWLLKSLVWRRRKKMSSLEKERQDFLSTVEALKEEKKVLQSKLRKASGSGQSIDVIKNPASKKDMSTSTENLASMDPSSDDRRMNNSNDASGLSLLHDDEQFEASSVYIPPDQTRMIQNINSLISELTLEKEELTQALSSELSQSSKLKELNNELSRKLEAQTQRLELLTARSMASEHIPARQPESQIMHDNTPYADEGDEVVERVLGWIMKLFPGGPSRRRTNKHIS